MLFWKILKIEFVNFVENYGVFNANDKSTIFTLFMD